jgi:hypothetical protein
VRPSWKRSTDLQANISSPTGSARRRLRWTSHARAERTAPARTIPARR